jgi:hypothetical protein
MTDLCKRTVGNQFEAALSTINWCIELTSSKAWGGLVARYPFSQVVFHSLFFADYYLDTDPTAFRKQLFHVANAELFDDYEQLQDREPLAIYKKDQLMPYVEFCRQKALMNMATETASSLAATTTLTRYPMSRLELHLYNIRHLQHHAAQLVLRLRLEQDADIPWIGSQWQAVGEERNLNCRL